MFYEFNSVTLACENMLFEASRPPIQITGAEELSCEHTVP